MTKTIFLQALVYCFFPTTVFTQSAYWAFAPTPKMDTAISNSPKKAPITEGKLIGGQNKNLHFYLKTGAGVSQFKKINHEKIKWGPSTSLGLGARLKIREHISMELDVLYASQQSKMSDFREVELFYGKNRPDTLSITEKSITSHWTNLQIAPKVRIQLPDMPRVFLNAGLNLKLPLLQYNDIRNLETTLGYIIISDVNGQYFQKTPPYNYEFASNENLFEREIGLLVSVEFLPLGTDYQNLSIELSLNEDLPLNATFRQRAIMVNLKYLMNARRRS